MNIYNSDSNKSSKEKMTIPLPFIIVFSLLSIILLISLVFLIGLKKNKSQKANEPKVIVGNNKNNSFNDMSFDACVENMTVGVYGYEVTGKISAANLPEPIKSFYIKNPINPNIGDGNVGIYAYITTEGLYIMFDDVSVSDRFSYSYPNPYTMLCLMVNEEGTYMAVDRLYELQKPNKEDYPDLSNDDWKFNIEIPYRQTDYRYDSKYFTSTFIRIGDGIRGEDFLKSLYEIVNIAKDNNMITLGVDENMIPAATLNSDITFNNIPGKILESELKNGSSIVLCKDVDKKGLEFYTLDFVRNNNKLTLYPLLEYVKFPEIRVVDANEYLSDISVNFPELEPYFINFKNGGAY